MKKKIALFCNVAEQAVITAQDVPTIYEVPLRSPARGSTRSCSTTSSCPTTSATSRKWERSSTGSKNPAGEVQIAIVGKYVELGDSYKSLNEALAPRRHRQQRQGAARLRRRRGRSRRPVPRRPRRGPTRILVPGGFGRRGIEGMIRAIRYAREKKVPFFGICLGMQCAVIEFARNVCGLEDANSTEFDANAPHKVIFKLRDLIGVEALGGTMRLGKYPCELADGSTRPRAPTASRSISRAPPPPLRGQPGVTCRVLRGRRAWPSPGMSPDGKFVEIVELPRPPLVPRLPVPPRVQVEALRGHPLFRDFIRAARAHRAARREGVAQKTASLEPPLSVPANLPPPNGQTA